jgi:hypothetical protein
MPPRGKLNASCQHCRERIIAPGNCFSKSIYPASSGAFLLATFIIATSGFIGGGVVTCFATIS